MRNKVEQFLSESPSDFFKVGQIAKELEMTKGQVKKQLKRLAKAGKVNVRKGRYRAAKSIAHKGVRSSRKTMPATEEARPAEPGEAEPDHQMQTNRRLEEAARSVGLRVEILQRWVDERKRMTSEDEAKNHLFGVLHDLEIARRMKVKDLPGG